MSRIFIHQYCAFIPKPCKLGGKLYSRLLNPVDPIIPRSIEVYHFRQRVPVRSLEGGRIVRSRFTTNSVSPI